MAVFSELWWSVWWPWALVWMATAVSAVIAAWILVVHWRAQARRPANQRHVRGIFYLDDTYIMDLYRQYGNFKALEQEVEEKSQKSKAGTVSASLHGVEAGASRSASGEVSLRYTKVIEPLTVIREIMDLLEEADDVVYVDLIGGSVTPNRELAESRRPAGAAEAAREDSVRMSDLDSFVSVRGLFRKGHRATEITTFMAPYGAADPEHGPKVRVECADNGLRGAVPEEPFKARCLGKVQSWNPGNRELVIQPVAIFK